MPVSILKQSTTEYGAACYLGVFMACTCVRTAGGKLASTVAQQHGRRSFTGLTYHLHLWLVGSFVLASVAETSARLLARRKKRKP